MFDPPRNVEHMNEPSERHDHRPFRPLEYDYHSHRPIQTLIKLVGRPWWFYLALLAVLLIKHSPVWVIPFLVAQVIDTLSVPGDFPVRQMTWYFAGVFLLLLQNVPMQTLFISMLSGAARDLEHTLRTALVTRLQQLSIAFHDRMESGRLQAKVLRDVEQVQTFCMYVFEGGMLALLSVVFAATVTALREPRLLVFFVAMVPIVAGLRSLFRRGIIQRNKDFRSEVERMSGDVAEMINMIPVVRAHGLETHETRRLSSQFGAVNQRGRRLDLINAVFGAAAFITFQFAMIVGLAVMSWFCLRGWITLGEIVLYQSLFGMIVMSVSQLLHFYPQMARGMESVRSIGEVLECPDLERNQGRASVAALSGQVEFERVTFTYAEGKPPAVADVSLVIEPGECVAWVGPSGAGKSTMMQLLIGFRRPQHGRILFDGLDMETIDMRSARRFISVVPQETILFSGSIRSNILYGLSDISDRHLWDVLAAAQLTEFVDGLPAGVDTRIGEDGALLSGGQRQRIAIARALIRNPRILVLDEATSSLDAVSERKVQEAIDLAIRDRTTFIVAHRLSTVRRADRIIVMQDGRIVDSGSYAELVDRPGLFRDMQWLQV
jgi:ATP-binding cassette, subfamily B, bacterial